MDYQFNQYGYEINEKNFDFQTIDYSTLLFWYAIYLHFSPIIN